MSTLLYPFAALEILAAITIPYISYKVTDIDIPHHLPLLFFQEGKFIMTAQVALAAPRLHLDFEQKVAVVNQEEDKNLSHSS